MACIEHIQVSVDRKGVDMSDDAFRLMEYVTFLKHRYFDVLSKLSWDELVRNRDASFNSMRDVFLHIVNVEDSYINYILAKKGGKYTPYDFSKFNSLDAIRRQMDEVEAKTKRCLSSITAEELAAQYEWTRFDGTTMRGRGEDIITHLALEQTHHLGELICLLWQINVEPPHIGWLQYLSQTTPAHVKG